MNKLIRSSLFSAAVGVASLAGCAHDTTPPPSVPHAEYQLGREDVVQVEVWKDPALSAKVPVRPDGKISLPMIGEVDAEGRTASDLQKEISTKLQPMVHDPVVTVMVSEINATKFYVLGEVTHPGAFPVRGAVSVVQAIAMAGGPTEFANPRKIVVIRPSKDGKEQRFNVNYKEVLNGKAQALQLASGDTIYVP